MMMAAIIQARMSSTRLPGKVLKTVLGKPLLAYQAAQLRRVSKLDKIIIATTVNRKDDPIAEFCEKEGLLCFRGSESDVLERYYQTSVQYNIDPIIRITGDCPFFDPSICNEVIDIYLAQDTEYVVTGQTFSEGVDCEIFSFKALEEAYYNANLKSEREHPTLYLYNRPARFKRIIYENKTNDSKYRFSVDEPKDFEVAKAIIEGLHSEPGEFTAEKIKRFLDEHPDIFSLNSSIKRNEGLEKSLQSDEVIE